MKFEIFSIIAISIIVLLTLIFSFDNNDPYSEGSHYNYNIICENGFKYKQNNYGIILLLNKNGTPKKCD